MALCLRAYAGGELTLNPFDFTNTTFFLEIASGSMVGEDTSLKDPLFRCMIRAGTLAGKTYLAIDESEQIVGLAVWLKPGETLFAT